MTRRAGRCEPDQCRPVTVEVDGEPVTVRVRAEEPMSEQGRKALAAIIAAVKSKFDAEADQRCGSTIPSIVGDHERVCTRAPHPDSEWHADGTGSRWRIDAAGTALVRRPGAAT